VEVVDNGTIEARGGIMATEKETARRLSRREFVKGAAVGTAGAAAGALAGCAPAATPLPTEAPPAPTPVIKEIIKEVPVELQKAIGHVERDLQSCAGCRTCEGVCSLSHEGVNSPALARTWIVDYIVEGRRIEGYTCKQCEGPECLYACPEEGALYIDETTGARVIDPENCIGCGQCMRACPQYPNTPIRYDAGRQVCVKCDLCGGDPLCVKYCPESSLTLVQEEV
jgi:Fe-S-cluster-containing hydrogenase component 2